MGEKKANKTLTKNFEGLIISSLSKSPFISSTCENKKLQKNINWLLRDSNSCILRYPSVPVAC